MPAGGVQRDPILSEGRSVITPVFPRMELPTFDGMDPLAWIARAEQYFLVHETPELSKTKLAIVAMEGSAMGWVRWALRKNPTIPWSQFCNDLMDRFGDDSAINAYEALHTTRQTGDLEEYTSLFEARVVQLPEFPEAQYVGMFLGGLKKHIRDQIPDSAITDVHSAILAARKIARSSRPPDYASRTGSGVGHSVRGVGHLRSSPMGRESMTQSGSHSAANNPKASELTTGHHTSGNRGNQSIHRLSNEEYMKHRAAGTCFRCGGAFGPLHRCPLKALNVLIGEEEGMDELGVTNPLEEQEMEGESAELQLLLSELSSCGFDGPQTMKLTGQISRQKATVMIDSGASHCFIAKHIAARLKLPIDTSSKIAVLLGNGTRVQAQGSCTRIPLVLSGQVFHITCYVFPLSGVDIILGCSWLASLGDVKTNWSNLTMEFQVQGVTVKLQGDSTPARVHPVEPLLLPEKILSRRTVDQEGQLTRQVLVKWQHLGNEEASWMAEADMLGQFPEFSLEDKAALEGEAIDRTRLKVYQRGPSCGLV